MQSFLILAQGVMSGECSPPRIRTWRSTGSVWGTLHLSARIDLEDELPKLDQKSSKVEGMIPKEDSEVMRISPYLRNKPLILEFSGMCSNFHRIRGLPNPEFDHNWASPLRLSRPQPSPRILPNPASAHAAKSHHQRRSVPPRLHPSSRRAI